MRASSDTEEAYGVTRAKCTGHFTYDVDRFLLRAEGWAVLAIRLPDKLDKTTRRLTSQANVNSFARTVLGYEKILIGGPAATMAWRV